MTATRPALAPDQVGYPAVRRAVRALVGDRPETYRLPVPACPQWTVTGLLAHLVTVAEGALRRHGADVPPAGPAEVPALLDRWDRLGRRLDARLAAAGGGEVLVMDAYTHELDLRAALGVPPPVEHVAWAPSFEVLVRGFSGAVTARGLPALHLRTTGGSRWTAGRGPAAGSLTAPAHDLYRALAGRRSAAQLAAFTWKGDPARWLPAFTWGPFVPPAHPGV